MADSRRLTFSNPGCVAPPVARYSHIVGIPAGARLLVLAGQIGLRPDGSIAADATEQFEVALENVIAILVDQGATAQHIVKLNTWIVDGAPVDLKRTAAARARLLGDVAPASTLAFISRLYAPDILVELEAWAAVPP